MSGLVEAAVFGALQGLPLTIDGLERTLDMVGTRQVGPAVIALHRAGAVQRVEIVRGGRLAVGWTARDVQNRNTDQGVDAPDPPGGDPKDPADLHDPVRAAFIEGFMHAAGSYAGWWYETATPVDRMAEAVELWTKRPR